MLIFILNANNVYLAIQNDKQAGAELSQAQES